MSGQCQRYQPFTLGRFRIVPPGTPDGPHQAGVIDLVMARGAFGSGEHETTASCLELLGQLPVRSSRVLDLGSGTGILAIAALRMGAAAAVCVDLDPKAAVTADWSCRLNGVADRAHHIAGPLAALGAITFDLVLANLYADLLLALAGDIVARTRPGATLLLSGIPWEYNYDVHRRYQQLGCTSVSNRMLEEYSTLLLRAGD